MKKRSMSLFLAVVLTLSLAVPGLAVGAYTDTEGHWAAEAVERWSAKGVLQGGDGAFRPDDTITRAEMAVILDRLMVYITVAKNTFTDVQDGAWYTEALLGASAAGIMKGDGATMRPSASLTRQEAIVLLGRALGVKEDVAAISVFTDAAAVADWAKGYVGGMSAAGIIKGVDGRVNPTASITRAEVVTIMDNAVSAVYAAAGTYTEDAAGNVIVSAPGVVLKNMTIRGNLIVAEGVGTGECTLDGVTVKGRAIVRGGGEHSIIIKGDSDIAEIFIEQRDNNLRVAVQGDANVAIIVINDGKNDVLIEGNVGEVTLTTASAVTVTGTVKELIVAESAASADLTVAKTAKVETLTVAAEDTTVTVAGSVAKVDVAASATATSLSVEKGATVKTITTAADDVSLGGSGKVEKLTVTDGTGTTVSKDTTVTKVDNKSDEPVDVGGKDIPAGGTGSSSGNTGSTGGGGGNGGNGGTTTSTTVTDKAGLEAALANTKYSTITISGTIGATEAYSAYAVARPVTITGGTVYGSFIITAAGVTVRDVTMHTQGANNGPLKNCIDVIGNDVTITGCTFKLDARTDGLGTSFMGNGITVWPYGNAVVNINITGNTFIKLQSNVLNWSAAAIQVVEGLNISRFISYGDIGADSISKAITLSNEGGMAANNTYADCDNAYVHSNWTSGNPAFLYTYATTADQLSAGLNYAAENATIQLGDSFTVENTTLTIPETKAVVLELNGKTLTGTFDEKLDNGFILNDGTLTIQDTAKDGKITMDNANMVLVKNVGTLTLASGILENKADTLTAVVANNKDFTLSNGKIVGAVGVAVYGAASKTTMTGGEIVAKYHGISGNGTVKEGTQIYAGYEVVICGGTITSDDTVIYMPASGTVEISNGTFICTGKELSNVVPNAAAVVVDIRTGTLNITGGTFSCEYAQNESAEQIGGASGSITGVIVIGKNKGYTGTGAYEGDITVTISGATLTNSKGDVVVVNAVEFKNTDTNTLRIEKCTITGGVRIKSAANTWAAISPVESVYTYTNEQAVASPSVEALESAAIEDPTTEVPEADAPVAEGPEADAPVAEVPEVDTVA